MMCQLYVADEGVKLDRRRYIPCFGIHLAEQRINAKRQRIKNRETFLCDNFENVTVIFFDIITHLCTLIYVLILFPTQFPAMKTSLIWQFPFLSV